MLESNNALEKMGAVIVAYHPDTKKLLRLIELLIPSVRYLYVMDNGGAAWLEGAIKEQNWTSVFRVDMDGNQGISKALNRSFELLAEKSVSWIATFDQDSCPPTGMLQSLRAELNRPENNNQLKVAAIGPTIVDVRGNVVVRHPFIVFSKYSAKKTTSSDRNETFKVDHLITSGCLISVEAWRKVKFDENLFIDLVDIDWCWRVINSGYCLLGTGRVEMPHEISETGISKRFGRAVNEYNPIRRYYFVRNSVYLIMKKRLKIVQVAYLCRGVASAIFSALLSDADKKSSLSAIFRGVSDGLAGQMGSVSG